MSHSESRRRNRLRKPPRLLRLAGLARWPRPLVAVLLVIVILLLAVAWPSLVWIAAALWAIWAAAAVADAAWRGRQGVVAGLVAIVFGPLGASITSLFRRRAIRKVSHEATAWGAWYALIALLMAFVVSGLMMTVALTQVPHGADVPRAAMGDRVAAGDRVMIAPDWMLPISFGDIVAVERFKGIEDALGATGDIGGVGRIVGMPNQVIGAIDGALYICRTLPDATVGLQPENGCENLSEISYLQTPTPDFGPIQIPGGTYWVMSDDRSAVPLLDSRVYGPVPEDAIDGRVIAIVSPLSRIGIL